MQAKNTEEESADLYDRYTYLHKKILSRAYLWPRANGKEPLYGRVLSLLMIVNFMILLGMQIYHGYTVWDQLEISVGIAGYSTGSIVVLFQVIMFTYKKDLVRKLDSYNRDMWIEEYENEDNRPMMTSMASTVATLTRFIYYLINFSMLSYLSGPAIPIYRQWKSGVPVRNMSYDLPFLVASNFRNPMHNVAAYVLLVIGAITFILWLTGINCYFVVVIQYTILHMKLLQNDLLRLHRNANALLDLNNCIIKHNYIYRNADLIQEIYGPIVLSLFAYSIVGMCTLTFNIVILKSGPGGNVLISVFTLFVEIGLHFFYCFYGNMIIDESIKVSFAIYDVDWYESRPNELAFCNSLRIMLIRAQKPITLTACNFVEISLRTMANIMSSVISYVTIMKTMYERE